MKRKFLPGQIGVAVGCRNISGLIGYTKPEISFDDIPLVPVQVDLVDRVNGANWKGRGDEILEAIRQASVEMMVRNQARDKAAHDLHDEITRAADAYRSLHNLGVFSPEMFSMCRQAGNADYAWVVSNDTGEKVCEWRWNELRYDGAKAIMSFNFSAFDGLTTKDFDK